MKMLKHASLLLFATLLLTACGGNSAEKAAVNFHKAIINQDFDAAKKYCTKESEPMLDMMKSMMAMGGDKLTSNLEDAKDAKVAIVSSVIDKENKTATVILKTTIKGEDKEETYQLKEVDGEWKVVFSK